MSAPPRRSSDNLWSGHRVIWKKPDTWVPQLTAWLKPRFRANAMERLKPGQFRDLCWDDNDWLKVLDRCLRGNVDDHAEELGEALKVAVLRTYHGCRTEDAGSYFRDGIRVHHRPSIKARLREFIESHKQLHWMRDQFEKAIRDIDNEYDQGRVYVAADDTALLEHAAHYLIYGSEWILAALTEPGRAILKTIGVPTLIEVDLPLSLADQYTRREFAGRLLREWTRVTCNQPNWSAPIDFTFCLCADVPPATIVGHRHPIELKDPHDQFRMYRSAVTTCRYCGTQATNA